MTSRQLMLVAGALSLIALERVANAMLIVSGDDHDLTVRLLVAFVCGGLAPILFLLGCVKAKRIKTPSGGSPRGDNGA